MTEKECYDNCKTELSRYYCSLPGLISRCEKKIERLKFVGSPIDISAIDYSKPNVDGGKRNDAETDCENLVAEISNYNKFKSEKEGIDEVLNLLKPEQLELFEMIFKNKMTQEKIAEKLCVERTTVARRLKKALCDYMFYGYGIIIT